MFIASANRPKASPAYREGELLVRLRPGAAAVAQEIEGEVLHRYQFPTMNAVEDGELLHLRLPEGTTTAQALENLQDDPRVVYAAPNHIIEREEALDGKSSVPNDFDSRLWGMRQIQAPQAWAQHHGTRNGPIVAVLDTGVDEQHPDLAANLWTNLREIPGNGIDDDGNGYVDDVHGIQPKLKNGDIRDGHRHGTHTAGTIGAVGNNSQGVVGVNWEAQIMPIKIFDDKGQADAASIAAGLEYAARNGATITSNSWGGNVHNPVIEEAFARCPALHICASGNSTTNTDLKPHYPSTFDLPNLISVAATGKNDALGYFSNYGLNSVDLAAPGVDIYSTVPGGGYEFLSGTSMAAPMVSGAAALIASAYLQATPEEIKKRLLYSNDPIPELQGLVSTGGRLNLFRALEDDRQAPGPIQKLKVKSSDSRGVVLNWIAPGDDGQKGTASLYDVRYSAQPIASQAEFEKATRVAVSAPRAAGTQEEIRVALRPAEQARELHVAIQALDNIGQSSGIASTRAQLPAARTLFDGSRPENFQKDGDWAFVTLPEGGQAWSDSPQGEARPNQNTGIWTPPISLKGAHNTTAVFEAQTDLDSSDTLWLQVSKDGETWSPVGSITGSHPWEEHQIDLSRFDGQKKLQFRFSLVTGNNSHKDGVSIRKVALLAD